MKKLINIYIILLFPIILFSCNEKKEVNKSVDESFKSDSSGNPVESKKQEQKADVIDGLKLAEFLPASVPGCEKTPDKIGENDEDNRKITIASSEYIFPNNGFLKFSITDYGNYKFIPDYELKLFSQPPDVSGSETEQFIIAYGKGYVTWDDYRKEGTLYALVADRFIVRIDGIRLTQSTLKLQDYVKYFKIKELIKSVR
ncbi:MAG: hypothetical protein V1779_05670 [bacterium]